MRTPGFWSYDKHPLVHVLAPFSTIYAAATRWRLKKAPRYRAPVPVICVGNVTAGGSGKTPVVQALVKAAIARGIAVHCLTRGYGGDLPGPVRVDAATHDSKAVGDEALLLAALAPTWVARDRAAGAEDAVIAGAQLIIMDDGLQNPAVAYDLSLLVIDGGFGFGNGRIIPAGPLREPVQAAASRVQAAIIIGEDMYHTRSDMPSGLPVIRSRVVSQDAALAGRKIVAFAGLGRPKKFLATLKTHNVVGWFAFPDHHEFTADDLHRLDSAATAQGAVLVTTEKDYVRLPPEFRAKVTVVPIDLVPDDAGAWDRLLDRVVK
jgi:tetraacyldisaccharide 4'-kinase